MASASPTATNDDRTREFAELDLVRLKFDTADDDVIFRENALGTIVYVHERGAAFEVEFSEPISAVLTLGPLDIFPANDPA
jgi:Domain of unknown function (DUF4926)